VRHVGQEDGGHGEGLAVRRSAEHGVFRDECEDGGAGGGGVPVGGEEVDGEEGRNVEAEEG